MILNDILLCLVPCLVIFRKADPPAADRGGYRDSQQSIVQRLHKLEFSIRSFPPELRKSHGRGGRKIVRVRRGRGH